MGNNPPLVSPFPLATAVQDVKPSGLTVFSCYPNPTDGEIHIQFYLAAASRMEVSLLSMDGKRIFTLTSAAVNAGLNTYTFNANGTAPGTYVLQLHTLTCSYQQQITVR